MDDLDLYDDLDEFQEQQEKKSKELQQVEDKYVEATKTIQNLQDENKGLKKKMRCIELSFQSLLDTARNEIKRKDKEIERLRKEKDDICFRRKFPNRPQKPMESAASHQQAAKNHIALPESNDFLPLEVTTNANDVSETKGRGRSPERSNDSHLDTHKRHRSRDGRNPFQEYKRQRNDDDVAAKPLFYRRDSRHDDCAEESQKSLDFQRRDTSQNESSRGRSAKNERNEKTDRNRDRYDKDCGYERRKTSRSTADSPERSDYRNQRSESHHSSKDNYGRKKYFPKSPVRRENVDYDKYNNNDTKSSERRGRHHSNRSPDHRHRDEGKRIRSPNKTDGKGRNTDKHSFKQASSDTYTKKHESKERDHNSTDKHGDKKALTAACASANVDQQSRKNAQHSINEVGGFHHNPSEQNAKNDNPDIQPSHTSHSTMETTESLTSALKRIRATKDLAMDMSDGSSKMLKSTTKDIHEKDEKLQQISKENSEKVNESISISTMESKDPQRPLINNNKNISVEDYLYGNFDEHQQDVALETGNTTTDHLQDTQHLDVDDIENMLYGNLEDVPKMDKDERVKHQIEKYDDEHKSVCSSLSQTRDNLNVEVYEIPDDDIPINKANEQDNLFTAEDVDFRTNRPIVVEDVVTCQKSDNHQILHANCDDDLGKLLQSKTVNSIDSNLISNPPPKSCTPHKVALFDTLFGPSPSSASSTASNTNLLNSIKGILSTKSKDDDNDSTITSPGDYSNDTATNKAMDNQAQQFDEQELNKCFKKNAELTLSSPGDSSSDCVVVETTSKVPKSHYDKTELVNCSPKRGGQFKGNEEQLNLKCLKENTNKRAANKALGENSSACVLMAIPKAADDNPRQVTSTNSMIGAAYDSKQHEVSSKSDMITASSSKKFTDVSQKLNDSNEVPKCLDNTKIADTSVKSATITSHGDSNNDCHQIEVSLAKKDNSFTTIGEGLQQNYKKSDISDQSSATTTTPGDASSNCRLIVVTSSKEASDIDNSFDQESQKNTEKPYKSDKSPPTTSGDSGSVCLITVPSTDNVVTQNLNDINETENRFTTILDEGSQEPTEMLGQSNNTSTTSTSDTRKNSPADVTPSKNVDEVAKRLYDTNETENRFTTTLEESSQEPTEMSDKSNISLTTSGPRASINSCPAVVTPSKEVVKVTPRSHDKSTVDTCLATIALGLPDHTGTPDQTNKSSITTSPADSDSDCLIIVTPSKKDAGDGLVIATPSMAVSNASQQLYNNIAVNNTFKTVGEATLQNAETPDGCDKSSTSTSPTDSDSDCQIIVTPSKKVIEVPAKLYNKNELDNCFVAIGEQAVQEHSKNTPNKSLTGYSSKDGILDTEFADKSAKSSTTTSPGDSDSDCLIIATPCSKTVEDGSQQLYNKNEIDKCFVEIGQRSQQESDRAEFEVNKQQIDTSITSSSRGSETNCSTQEKVLVAATSKAFVADCFKAVTSLKDSLPSNGDYTRDNTKLQDILQSNRERTLENTKLQNTTTMVTTTSPRQMLQNMIQHDNCVTNISHQHDDNSTSNLSGSTANTQFLVNGDNIDLTEDDSVDEEIQCFGIISNCSEQNSKQENSSMTNNELGYSKTITEKQGRNIPGLEQLSLTDITTREVNEDTFVSDKEKAGLVFLQNETPVDDPSKIVKITEISIEDNNKQQSVQNCTAVTTISQPFKDNISVDELEIVGKHHYGDTLTATPTIQTIPEPLKDNTPIEELEIVANGLNVVTTLTLEPAVSNTTEVSASEEHKIPSPNSALLSDVATAKLNSTLQAITLDLTSPTKEDKSELANQDLNKAATEKTAADVEFLAGGNENNNDLSYTSKLKEKTNDVIYSNNQYGLQTLMLNESIAEPLKEIVSNQPSVAKLSMEVNKAQHVDDSSSLEVFKNNISSVEEAKQHELNDIEYTDRPIDQQAETKSGETENPLSIPADKSNHKRSGDTQIKASMMEASQPSLLSPPSDLNAVPSSPPAPLEQEICCAESQDNSVKEDAKLNNLAADDNKTQDPPIEVISKQLNSPINKTVATYDLVAMLQDETPEDNIELLNAKTKAQSLRDVVAGNAASTKTKQTSIQHLEPSNLVTDQANTQSFDFKAANKDLATPTKQPLAIPYPEDQYIANTSTSTIEAQALAVEEDQFIKNSSTETDVQGMDVESNEEQTDNDEATTLDLTSPAKEKPENQAQDDGKPEQDDQHSLTDSNQHNLAAATMGTEDNLYSKNLTTAHSRENKPQTVSSLLANNFAPGNNALNQNPLDDTINLALTSPLREAVSNQLHVIKDVKNLEDISQPINAVSSTNTDTEVSSKAKDVSTADLCDDIQQTESSHRSPGGTKTQDPTDDSAIFDLTSPVKEAAFSQTCVSQEDQVPKEDNKHLNTVINSDDIRIMMDSISEAIGTVTASNSEAKSTTDSCENEQQTKTAPDVNETQNLSKAITLELTSPIKEIEAHHSYRLQDGDGIQHIDDVTAYTGTEVPTADLSNIELQSKSSLTITAQTKIQHLIESSRTTADSTKTQDLTDETATLELTSPAVQEVVLNQSCGSKSNPTIAAQTKTQDLIDSSRTTAAHTKTHDLNDVTVTLDLTSPPAKEVALNQSCETQEDASSDQNIPHLIIVNKSIQLTNVTATTETEETMQMEIEHTDLQSNKTETISNESCLKHWMTSHTNTQNLLKGKETATAVNIPGLDLIQPESLEYRTETDVCLAQKNGNPNDDNPPLMFNNVTKPHEIEITHAVVGSNATESSLTSRTESHHNKTATESVEHTEEEYLYLSVSGKATEVSGETITEHSQTTDNSFVGCETQQTNSPYVWKKKDTKAVIIPGLDLVHTENRQDAADALHNSIANKSPNLADKKVIDLNSNDVGVHHALPARDDCERFLKVDETIKTLESKSAQVADASSVSTASLIYLDSTSLREQCETSKDLNECPGRQLEGAPKVDTMTTKQLNDKPVQNNMIQSLDAIESHPGAESNCQPMALKLNTLKCTVLKQKLANKDNNEKGTAMPISSSLSQDNLVQEIDTTNPTNTSYDNEDRSYLWSEIENFVIKKKIKDKTGAKVEHTDSIPSTQPKTSGGRQNDVVSKLDDITGSGSLSNKAEQLNLLKDCNELESDADAASKSQPVALEPKALYCKALKCSTAAKNKETIDTTAADTQSSSLPMDVEQITLNSKVEQQNAKEISSDQFVDQHIQLQPNSLYLAQILPHGQQDYPKVWFVGNNTPSDGLHSIKESYDRSSSTQFDDIISYEQNLTIVENTAKQLVASTEILGGGGGEASHRRKAVNIQMGDKGSYTAEEFIAQPNYFRAIGNGGSDTDHVSKDVQISSLSDSSKTIDANEFNTTAANTAEKGAKRHLPYTANETSSKNPTTQQHSSPVTPPSSISNSKDLPNSTHQQQQQISSLNILNILKAAKISLCPLNTTPTTPKRSLSNSTIDSTNSLKTSTATTISDNYGLPNILPSISTKCPTPPNFSGIFSKRNMSESVLENVQKNKQKLSNNKEHILPATRVLCNIKNLENEMTEIEDDTDIDNSDEERPLMQENKGNVNTTFAKQDNTVDKAAKPANGTESPQSKKSNISRKSSIARRNTIDTLPAKCSIPSTKVLEELQRFKQLTITRVPPCKVTKNRTQSTIITPHKTLSGAPLMAAPPAIRVKSAESLMAATDLVQASAIKTNSISTSLPILSQHKNEFSLAANCRKNKIIVSKEQKMLPTQKRNRGRPPKQPPQQQQQVSEANVGGRVSKGTKDNRAVNCTKEMAMKHKEGMSSVIGNGTEMTTKVKATVAGRCKKLTLETGGSISSQNLGSQETTAVPKDNREGVEENNAMTKAPALVGHNDYAGVARGANAKCSLVTAAQKTAAAHLNTNPNCVDEESPLKSDDNSDKNTSMVYEKLHSSDEQNSSVAENSEPECNKYLKEDAAKVTKECHVVLERTILDESNRRRLHEHDTKSEGSNLIFKPADKMALSNYKIPKLKKSVVDSSDSINKNKIISLEDMGIKGRPFTAQLSTFKIPKLNKVGDEIQKNSCGTLKSQHLVPEVKVTKKDQRVEKILEAAATLRGTVAYQRQVQHREEKDEETCELVEEQQEADGNASFKERTAMASARQRALEEYSKRLNKVFNPLGFDLYADTNETDNRGESTLSRNVLNTSKETESGLYMLKSNKETDKSLHHQATTHQERQDESNSEDQELVEKTKRNQGDLKLLHKPSVVEASNDTAETFNTKKLVRFTQKTKKNDNTPKAIVETKRKQATGTAAAKFNKHHETEHDEEELYAMYVKARNEYIRLQQQLLGAIGGEDGVTEKEELQWDNMTKTENAVKASTTKTIKMRRKTIHSLEENQEESGENCSEYIKKKASTAAEPPRLTPVSKRRKSMYCETSYSPVPSQDTNSWDIKQNIFTNAGKKMAVTETATKDSEVTKPIKLRRKSMYADINSINDNDDEIAATDVDSKEKSSKPIASRRKSMCGDMLSRTCDRNTPELNGHYSNNSDVDQTTPNGGAAEDKKPIMRNRRKSTHTPSYEEIDSDHDNPEDKEHVKKKVVKSLRPRRKSTYLERKEKLVEDKIQKQTKVMNARLCNIVDEGKPDAKGLQLDINTSHETQKDINESDDNDNLPTLPTETNRIEQNIEFVAAVKENAGQSADVTPIKSFRMHKKSKQAEKLALEAKNRPPVKNATDNSNKDAEKTHNTQSPNNNLPNIVDNSPVVSGNIDINQPLQNRSKSLYMETHQQTANDHNTAVDLHSDSDTLSTPNTNAIKMRRKSINLQRRILDSTSDDDDDDESAEKTATMAATKPVIKNTTVASSIPPAAATKHSPPRKRRRIVKVLSTSLEDTPVSKKIKYIADQVEATISASPSPSHPIFHTQVTEKPQGSMTPFAHDARFSEIDSRLHDMFQSPQHEIELNKSLATPESTLMMMSSSTLSLLPEPQLNVTGPNITIDETVCTQQEHNDSSVNISCSNDSTSLNSSNQSKTKHLSLGSSEYRFEKVSDNVVNLFISRKRRRNKNTTN